MHVCQTLFYLGARKDPQTGLWHWISSGKSVNFGVFSTNNVNYGQNQELIAISKGGQFLPRVDKRFNTVSAICETPSKYVKANPQPPPDAYPLQLQTFDEYKSNVTNATYLFAKFALPWMSARAACEERRGYLAQMETPRENDDIMKQIKGSCVKRIFGGWGLNPTTPPGCGPRLSEAWKAFLLTGSPSRTSLTATRVA